MTPSVGRVFPDVLRLVGWDGTLPAGLGLKCWKVLLCFLHLLCKRMDLEL